MRYGEDKLFSIRQEKGQQGEVGKGEDEEKEESEKT